MDEDGNSVGISAVECCVKPCNSFESAEYRDKKVVYCGYLIHHWGHFLVEELPGFGIFWKMIPPWIAMYLLWTRARQEKSREITKSFSRS